MVGSSIVRALKKRGDSQIITKQKSDLNLTNQDEVNLFLKNIDLSLFILLRQRLEVLMQIINTGMTSFLKIL